MANRTYGRVDAHGGEYVETEFWSVPGLRLPLVPVRSFWITEARHTRQSGFAIQLHRRSVAAAYLRCWAPGVALAGLALSGATISVVLATALLGACAWSWTWWPRDPAMRRRGDFDFAALGTRCDPRYLTDAMRDRVAQELAVAAGEEARPPEAVFRFGARTTDEALSAFGLLRLEAGRTWRARGAGRRFDGTDYVPLRAVRRRSHGAPYRDRLVPEMPELWAMLSAAAELPDPSRRAMLRRLHGAIPGSGVFVPPRVASFGLWLIVLGLSTVCAGFVVHGTVAIGSRLVTTAGWWMWIRLWRVRIRATGPAIAP